MEYIIEHALGLILIVLVAYSIYQKTILIHKIDEMFTEKVEKPVKADLRIQEQVEKKMDEALEVKPFDEVIAERNKS